MDRRGGGGVGQLQVDGGAIEPGSEEQVADLDWIVHTEMNWLPDADRLAGVDALGQAVDHRLGNCHRHHGGSHLIAVLDLFGRRRGDADAGSD